MTKVAETRTPRGRREWAAIIGLPFLVNALLAAYLMTRIEAGTLPILVDIDAPATVVGSPREPLPEPSRSDIVAAVERETNSVYACAGPSSVSHRVVAWSCRTNDAVAILQGTGSDGIFLIDVTWFGFDESHTELPAWAEAAFGPTPEADRAARWVAEHLGTEARTRIGGATISVDGSEGARTLVVHGD